MDHQSNCKCWITFNFENSELYHFSKWIINFNLNNDNTKNYIYTIINIFSSMKKERMVNYFYISHQGLCIPKKNNFTRLCLYLLKLEVMLDCYWEYLFGILPAASVISWKLKSKKLKQKKIELSLNWLSKSV